QILVNLASDAIKYAPAGATVQLAAQAGEQAGERGGAAGWFICVRDDGRGLTAAEREHLADSFTRLECERESGEPAIGLTIVRRLAEFMGGRIDVVNEDEGAGSEFRVWLPASAAPPAAAPEHAGATASGAPRLSIVYIEDNPVNVILVKELVA